MLTQDLRNKIQLLWDRLWGGGLSNPITAIENISYLLFMKRLEKFHPKVPNEYKWSNYKDLKGNILKKRVDQTFSFIQNDFTKSNEPFAIQMRNARFEITTPSLLEDAVKIVDEIFTQIEKEEKKKQHFQDIQGDVYEYLLAATNEAGKNGQFRTPRHIIQMMAELLRPDIKNVNTKICDVTSGTSGFLVGMYQYILKENSIHKVLDEDNHLERGLDGDRLKASDKRRLVEKTFYGFDIDATMVRIGMMNMIMHGLDKPTIKHLNTLSEDYEYQFLSSKTKLPPQELIKGKNKAQYDRIFPTLGREEFTYILANPPFAAKVNSKTISKNLNRVYEIKNNNKTSQALQTELLFLERIIYMLKKGGRAAVIVPEGVLFNSGKTYKKLREILLKDCILEAVISLPSGVFNPYTAVKTSILLFTMKEFNSTKYHTKKVWFYGMDSDGYTLDTNRKKILDDYPLPLVINEFKLKDTKSQSDRKKKHFFIDIKTIVENKLELNYNKYLEIAYQPKGYSPPKLLLEQLINLEESIFKNFTELKKEIG